jgi:hypothetical protein
MDTKWRKMNAEDGGEFLFATYKAAGLEQAMSQAQIVVETAIEHQVGDELHISLSSDGVTLMLQFRSHRIIEEKDWAIANDIESRLGRLNELIG